MLEKILYTKFSKTSNKLDKNQNEDVVFTLCHKKRNLNYQDCDKIRGRFSQSAHSNQVSKGTATLRTVSMKTNKACGPPPPRSNYMHSLQ